MVTLSNKQFLAIIILIAIGIAVSFAAIANFGGLGDKLKGIGGPASTGLYNLVARFPQFALSGGWPTMAASIGIIAFLCIGTGYLFEQKQVCATITGNKNVGSNMVGNLQREPEDAETLKTGAK